MMTARVFGVPFAVLLAAGYAGQPGESHGSAEVSPRLGDFVDDDSQLSLVMVNKSPSEIVVDGLFSIGYFQSPIEYEFRNLGSSRNAARHEAPSAVIVNPEEYRVILHPGGIYGTMVGKRELAVLYGLSDGQYYDVRAVYKSMDKTYTQGIWKSDFSTVCF